MRRRPTSVYRVLDEEELLSGSDYVDGFEVTPAEEIAQAGGLRSRTHVLLACAGALVLAVLVARLASILLGGAGVGRGARAVNGRRSGSPAMFAGSAVASAPTHSSRSGVAIARPPQPGYVVARPPLDGGQSPGASRLGGPAGSPTAPRRVVAARRVSPAVAAQPGGPARLVASPQPGADGPQRIGSQRPHLLVLPGGAEAERAPQRPAQPRVPFAMQQEFGFER